VTTAAESASAPARRSNRQHRVLARVRDQVRLAAGSYRPRRFQARLFDDRRRRNRRRRFVGERPAARLFRYESEPARNDPDRGYFMMEAAEATDHFVFA
jgi:hypothetical protein